MILVIRSSRSLIKQLMVNRRETTLASILLLMVILLTIGSSLMLFVESKAPEANIQTGGDAMWWALVTISTVGYGDHFPVTNAGKILASGLIICGVGIFGMISGLITSLITSPTEIQKKRSENKERLLLEVLERQQEILIRLEKIERQQNKNEEPQDSSKK